MGQGEWEQQIDALSVYRACEQIEDGRHKRGMRYSVALIGALILLGKLAGMTSLAGIAQWVRRLSRLAEPGLADHAQKLSVRGNRESCAASRRCRASAPSAQ